ncbi:hypothetical protein ACLMJK_001719 [Lecanora helva]
MARAYQEAHIVEKLTSDLKTIQLQTAELSKAKGFHDEKITNLQKQNAEQAKRIEALEIRVKASDHNTTARLLNAHAYHTRSLHAPLTPLRDLSTNRPIRQFPKHERDIKTMGPAQVIQVLQALDVPTLGMSAAGKKGELRAQVGLPREDDGPLPAPGAAAGGAAAVAGKAEEKGEEGKGNANVKVPRQKSLPKIAPGSTAEAVGKTGTAAAKGVSKPVTNTGGKGEEKKT